MGRAKALRGAQEGSGLGSFAKAGKIGSGFVPMGGGLHIPLAVKQAMDAQQAKAKATAEKLFVQNLTRPSGLIVSTHGTVGAPHKRKARKANKSARVARRVNRAR